MTGDLNRCPNGGPCTGGHERSRCCLSEPALPVVYKPGDRVFCFEGTRGRHPGLVEDQFYTVKEYDPQDDLLALEEGGTWAASRFMPAMEQDLPPMPVEVAQVLNVLAAADAVPADAVNLPEHYARFPIEPIRFIAENKLNFMVGNVIKYVLRWDAKDGIQDLHKARRYLEMFIKLQEGDPDWWKKEQAA